MENIEERARLILRQQFKLLSTKKENLMNKENIKKFLQCSIDATRKRGEKLATSINNNSMTDAPKNKEELKPINEQLQKLQELETQIQVYEMALKLFDEEFENYIRTLESTSNDISNNISELKDSATELSTEEYLQEIKDNNVMQKEIKFTPIYKGQINKLPPKRKTKEEYEEEK